MSVPDERAVVLWRPPPEGQKKRAEAITSEQEARIAVAKARQQHAEMQAAGLEFVTGQFKKWLHMAQNPDFENAIGPIDPATILKLAEFVSKNFRLDHGQATENIAHAIAPSIDFSKLSQQERDQWRALVTKGRGENATE